MIPGGLDAHWWWLIAAALLPIPLPFQLALFGLLAMAAVFGGRRHYERNPVPSSDPSPNTPVALAGAGLPSGRSSL